MVSLQSESWGASCQTCSRFWALWARLTLHPISIFRDIKTISKKVICKAISFVAVVILFKRVGLYMPQTHRDAQCWWVPYVLRFVLVLF